jgi:hypothetical protein
VRVLFCHRWQRRIQLSRLNHSFLEVVVGIVCQNAGAAVQIFHSMTSHGIAGEKLCGSSMLGTPAPETDM